jgi:hypothetical protein
MHKHEPVNVSWPDLYSVYVHACEALCVGVGAKPPAAEDPDDDAPV